jgi:parvulin-like peptidyl-prolyl isomerase
VPRSVFPAREQVGAVRPHRAHDIGIHPTVDMPGAARLRHARINVTLEPVYARAINAVPRRLWHRLGRIGDTPLRRRPNVALARSSRRCSHMYSNRNGIRSGVVYAIICEDGCRSNVRSAIHTWIPASTLLRFNCSLRTCIPIWHNRCNTSPRVRVPWRKRPPPFRSAVCRKAFTIEADADRGSTSGREKMATPAPQRRLAAPRPTDGGSSDGVNRWSFVWIVLALVIGIVIGAVYMRARNNRMAKEVIVSVNGVNITKDVFLSRLQTSKANTRDLASLQRQYGVNVLRSMVIEQFYLLLAKQDGVLPSNADVDKEYENVKKRTPNFHEQMKRDGLRPEDVKLNLRVALARAAIFTKGITVTPEDAQRFYQMNINPKNPSARFYSPEMAQVAVIITDTESAGKKALRELESPGAKWQDVVRKYSVDPNTRDTGGIMRPIKRTNAPQIKELEDTIFKIKIRQRIGPVKFRGKWWIIWSIDKRAEKTTPYEEVKSDCELGAKALKAGKEREVKASAEFSDFVNKANVQVFWPQYKTALTFKETK